MSDETQPFNKPWLVAVWPGMGQVAISAGYYMLAKLGMHVFAEFSPAELFDVEHVEVQAGIIRAGRLPRSRCFAWRDPKKQHDILLFIGEAQPPSGKRAFCHALVHFAKSLGVERIITFAAMATKMHPEKVSRAFGAATNPELLAELTRLGAVVLEEGHIGGLNGVVLAEADAAGLPGACLLGEMPNILAQIPFPGASLAVLKIFSALAEVPIDLDELIDQADELGNQLANVMSQAKEGTQRAAESDEEEEEEIAGPEPIPEKKLSDEDEHHLEALFAQAREDRSKAFELKQELDRLGVFHDYEDEFLNLFQRPEA